MRAYSASDRVANEEFYLEGLTEYGVPEHLHGGLVRYLVQHIQPGHFLTAVLENDLREAMGRADDVSRAGLYSIVLFLYNDAPAPCWGSPEAVAAWLKARSAVDAR